MSKFFIDPGHGGAEPGACANGVIEKVINLTVSLRVREILQSKGHTVYMSRTTDKEVGLDARCRLANATNAEYFLAIHHNAGGGIGYEVIHSISNGKGKELAYKVAEQFDKIGQRKHAVYSRQGSNGDYYAVIRGTSMSAIITEFCYLDTSDVSNTSPARLEQEAMAIANACLIQVGDTVYNPTPAPKPQQSGQIFRVQVGAFTVKANADKFMNDLKTKGFSGFITQVGNLYKVQVGAFSVKSNADKLLSDLKAKGFNGFIV